MLPQPPGVKKAIPYQYQFVAARAVAISLVLVWHLGPIRIVANDRAGVIAKTLHAAVGLFNSQVTLIAVPIFILVSLHLLYERIEVSGFQYLSRRLRRLSALFVTWSTFQFVCFYGAQVLSDIKRDRSFSWPTLGISPLRLLMEGGPPLPHVGSSVFYFLFVLMARSVLGGAFCGLARKLPKPALAVWCLAVPCLVYFEARNLSGRPIPYWRLDNFLVYIPLAYQARRYRQSTCMRLGLAFVACFVVFSIQDVFLRLHGGSVGVYSRVSIVCGAAGAFALFQALKPIELPAFAAFLGKYSLGIFATHKYWQFVVLIALRHWSLFPATWFLDVTALIRAVICILLTCGTLYLIGLTRCAWLVR